MRRLSFCQWISACAWLLVTISLSAAFAQETPDPPAAVARSADPADATKTGEPAAASLELSTSRSNQSTGSEPTSEPTSEPANQSEGAQDIHPSLSTAGPSQATTRPADNEALGDANPDASTSQNLSDADRAARLKNLLSLVTDNTLFSHRRENPAYFALVKQVKDRSFDELRAQARENVRFNEFYREPAEHRGELVHLTLNLRRVLPVPIRVKNEAGVQELFEVWGWTEEAKAWMYCAIVPELPPGIEVGDSAHLVELTGFFFKMQAYQPGDAAPNARNLVAPLIIGRIKTTQKPAPQADAMTNWPLVVVVGFGMVILLRLMMNIRLFGRPAPTHRNFRRRSLEPIDTDSLGDTLSEPTGGLKIRNANEL